MPHIWFQTDSTGHRRLILRTCDECPCRKWNKCEPRDIAFFYTSGQGHRTDLTPYKKKDTGFPGARWRLIETSDCYLYMSGEIDKDGFLDGLPDSFTSDYGYEGHLILQQGCPDEFGVVHWPHTGCPALDISN